MERIEALVGYYTTHDENSRLVSKHGSVEFITTVHYIEKYLAAGMNILEIGAGTGRYSHFFARKGFEVDSVELMPCNIEIFKENITSDEKITITQGDALDLKIEDNKYDITLLLGPMYHLYTEAEQKKALAEAIRVTKKDGIIFVAYCCMDMTMYQFCVAKNMLKSVLEENKIEKETFRLLSKPEDVFQMHRKTDIDKLMQGFNVTRLHYVGTDMLVHFVREGMDALDDESFAFYMKYHLSICERPDMVGATNHILDVMKKSELEI